MGDLIALFMAALFILGAYRRLRRRPIEDQRSNQLRPLAVKLALDFTDQGEPVFLSARHPFTVFQLGEAPRFRNVMYGILDKVEVAVFDLHYETGGDAGYQQHALTVCSFHVTGTALPRFELRRKGSWDGVLVQLGNQDLAPADRPEFSQSYLLRGEPEEAVRALFNAPVLEKLEALGDVALEGRRDILLFYRPGRLAAPVEIETLLRQTLETLVLFRPEAEAGKPLAG